MNALRLLPARLRQRSRSTEEIVLPIDQAIRAIDILSSAGWAVRGWEGLVVYRDGREERPTEFQRELGVGQYSYEHWDDFVRRSALLCRTSIMEAHNSWTLRPDSTGAQMWFSLQAEGSGD